LTYPDIGGHDDESILEINLTTQAVSKNSLIKHL